MKKTKRSAAMLTLAVILSLTVITSMFASCSSGNNVSSGGAGSSKGEQSSQASGNEQSAEKSWKDDNSPIELTMFADAAYFNEVWQDTVVAKKVQEATGVRFKLDFPATDDSNQRLSMLIASDDLPDLVMAWRNNVMWHDMISSGKMNDMEELIDKYAPGMRTVVDPQIIDLNRYRDGKVYYITNYTLTNNYYEQAKKYDSLVGANQGTFLIRDDLYKSIGSPEIKDKDTLTAALVTLHEKYPDNIAFFPRGTVDNSFGILAYYIDGKEAKHKVLDPRYKEMLLWMNELAIQGILTKDSFVNDSSTASGMVQQGLPIVYAWTLGESGRSPEAFPDTTYEALDPWPTYRQVSGLGGWLGIGVPVKSKNAERTMMFLEYMNSQEGITTYQYGVEGDTYVSPEEGAHWKMVNGKPTYLKEYLEARQKDWTGTATKSGMDAGYNCFGFDTLYPSWVGWSEADPLYKRMNKLYGPLTIIDNNMSIDFEAGSEPLIVRTKIGTIIEEERVKVIFAKTPDEAEKAFEEMMNKITAANVDVYNKYVTEQYFKD